MNLSCFICSLFTLSVNEAFLFTLSESDLLRDGGIIFLNRISSQIKTTLVPSKRYMYVTCDSSIMVKKKILHPSRQEITIVSFLFVYMYTPILYNRIYWLTVSYNIFHETPFCANQHLEYTAVIRLCIM